MISIQRLLLFLLVFGNLTSCVVPKKFSSIQIEVMRPGVVFIPHNLKAVAVINRNLYRSDTCVIKYSSDNASYEHPKLSKNELSNTFVDALALYLKTKGEFQKVKNYGECLNNQVIVKQDKNIPDEWFKATNSDICIFLDFFTFRKNRITFNGNILSSKAYLNWSIAFKDDTSNMNYNFFDSISIKDAALPQPIDEPRPNKKTILNYSADYLGGFIANKILPTWIPVERTYYLSRNVDMMLAEEYVRKKEWLKAAEIWNEKTKSKNRKLAAKANYNMALASEMEGRPGLAIDWLKKSVNGMGKYNQEHNTICKQYLDVLALRKRETEQLDKQVGNRHAPDNASP